MITVGTILKTEREKQELTLEQVSRVTYIRESYLHALEEDNYDVIPGDVYAKGFIRNYGNFLGLSGIALIDRFNQVRLTPRVEVLEPLPTEEIKEKVYLDNQDRIQPVIRKSRARKKQRPLTLVEWSIILGGISLFLVFFIYLFFV